MAHQLLGQHYGVTFPKPVQAPLERWLALRLQIPSPQHPTIQHRYDGEQWSANVRRWRTGAGQRFETFEGNLPKLAGQEYSASGTARSGLRYGRKVCLSV
uniref:(northern house mosquito) hypothetical protein n=1 Tax=Culex pipiens TaxID=7175 RepID=A0A8D8CCK5_CULPI